jgi:hypothetical protein
VTLWRFRFFQLSELSTRHRLLWSIWTGDIQNRLSRSLQWFAPSCSLQTLKNCHAIEFQNAANLEDGGVPSRSILDFRGRIRQVPRDGSMTSEEIVGWSLDNFFDLHTTCGPSRRTKLTFCSHFQSFSWFALLEFEVNCFTLKTDDDDDDAQADKFTPPRFQANVFFTDMSSQKNYWKKLSGFSVPTTTTSLDSDCSQNCHNLF